MPVRWFQCESSRSTLSPTVYGSLSLSLLVQPWPLQRCTAFLPIFRLLPPDPDRVVLSDVVAAVSSIVEMLRSPLVVLGK
ncbi:hypothetical protein J6590_029883 [Homalodisca vitripennis]|nr:hypothetical protein J6590_029883 [Homalodisca vitripennis]